MKLVIIILALFTALCLYTASTSKATTESQPPTEMGTEPLQVTVSGKDLQGSSPYLQGPSYPTTGN